MSFESRVDVVNHHGWHKSFVLQKNIVHIGSDERNDIVLFGSPDSVVAPRHAQLLPSPINRHGFRLINLADQPIEMWPRQLPPDAEPRILAPRDSADIVGGDCAQIGTFKLKFHGGDQVSDLLAIRVSMQGTLLSEDAPIHGMITVYHRGNQVGVQLKIEIDGVDPADMEMVPGPVLFPDTEKEIPFVIHHSRKSFPPAGEHQLIFHVTAPDVYPDERASVAQTIEVAPFYHHTLRMLPLRFL